MKMTMKKLALIAVLLITSMNAQAVETVKVFRGTGNTTTAIFTVEAPWLLDWNLNGESVASCIPNAKATACSFSISLDSFSCG